LVNAAYVNYIGDEGADGLRISYGEEKFARLAAIKSKYDPTNLFRMNQNIAPVSAAA
jgi:FAD/FMN-containing dehydrogenase